MSRDPSAANDEREQSGLVSHPKRRELRTFGLSVGLAFALLGGVSRWRGHELPPRVLWTIGAALLVAGLIAPGVLGRVQRGWMAFAGVLARVNTRIILTLLFYLVFTPVGLVLRLFRDPLNRSLRDRAGSQWVKREPAPPDLARYEQQF
jgi:hypothetical protein